ncbi:hypothetical protein SYNPS1DRAFT_26601 [Syncephalis pseudoplumigaleata]|uniref:Protein prenylyltransferase n=1 Tax=Syncephalis pseudoplumigaleata TaxID=1712513 RepID=A0A4P9Z581_9FUNG|nr:hypothetical protein SYNPS1DRAFT_26601 [Syncephalis pseudoplumigaleata]|eukprot:RKP27767.1 hypothetical protein SYNPS1DRAFT_26601 [Syncephalis pseudoplumigaleata]
MLTCLSSKSYGHGFRMHTMMRMAAILGADSSNISGVEAMEQPTNKPIVFSTADEPRIDELGILPAAAAPSSQPHDRAPPFLCLETWHRAHLQRELDLTERAFTLHPRNYYAWTQRAWLVDHARAVDATDTDIYARLIDAEGVFTAQWTAMHLSDSAAWHYRRRILAATATVHVWQGEMERVYDLVKRYPGHEAIWCHLRLVATLLLEASSVADRTRRLAAMLDWLSEEKRGWTGELQSAAVLQSPASLHALQHQLRHAKAYEAWISHAGQTNGARLCLDAPVKQLV